MISLHFSRLLIYLNSSKHWALRENAYLILFRQIFDAFEYQSFLRIDRGRRNSKFCIQVNSLRVVQPTFWGATSSSTVKRIWKQLRDINDVIGLLWKKKPYKYCLQLHACYHFLLRWLVHLALFFCCHDIEFYNQRADISKGSFMANFKLRLLRA